MQLNSYLNFKGECEEAFKFYENVLGGKIQAMIPFEGTPAAEHAPAEWSSKIMHASMTIGDTVVMGSDTPPDHYSEPKGISMSMKASVKLPIFCCPSTETPISTVLSWPLASVAASWTS